MDDIDGMSTLSPSDPFVYPRSCRFCCGVQGEGTGKRGDKFCFRLVRVGVHRLINNHGFWEIGRLFAAALAQTDFVDSSLGLIQRDFHPAKIGHHCVEIILHFPRPLFVGRVVDQVLRFVGIHLEIVELVGIP